MLDNKTDVKKIAENWLLLSRLVREKTNLSFSIRQIFETKITFPSDGQVIIERKKQTSIQTEIA